MSNAERNKRRKRKYQLLMNAGFNNKEATKYKDLSNYKVAELCSLRESLNLRLDPEYKLFYEEVEKILRG